ncbi:GGDEF domain-containing protein [Arcobacter sp. LA11]|uniref:GGDEF domain-containing protein n=1 Tax=Arcobacter sp. LA11 TaxID=1898176 RepID=UPI000933D5F7|nr:GGDEF domain-containing protein [Arcobacter sp. LA11]
MQKQNELNTYNFQAIIALNDHLVGLNRLDDIFNYIASYLKKDYSIDKFKATINSNQLYISCRNDKSLNTKEFDIKLNENDDLKITILYEDREEQDINNSISLVKMTFSIIAQTIYNKYLEYKLIEMTLKDSLTGLYNRQYVDEYLKSSLPLSNRENKKIGFLKVGIDHFKAVIDEFDYTTGDKVLKELAKSLEHTVRESDIVARIESDEFLIILHNIINENNAIMIADKIINNFKNVKVVVDENTKQTLMKTICTGISIYPDDADRIDEIFRSSDIALYEARNKGRSQSFKFQKDVDTLELF